MTIGTGPDESPAANANHARPVAERRAKWVELTSGGENPSFEGDTFGPSDGRVLVTVRSRLTRSYWLSTCVSRESPKAPIQVGPELRSAA